MMRGLFCFSFFALTTISFTLDWKLTSEEKAPVFKFMYACDFFGHDIDTLHVNLDNCFEACRVNLNCSFLTWRKSFEDKSWCWLKSSFGTRLHEIENSVKGVDKEGILLSSDYVCGGIFQDY